MYNYIDYLQRCFYKTVQWNENNLFCKLPNETKELVDFEIPNSLKLEISSRTTDNLASSLSISNNNIVNGSLAYIYSSVPLSKINTSKELFLNDVIMGEKPMSKYTSDIRVNNDDDHLNNKNKKTKYSFLYGRFFFPEFLLNAMIVKSISNNSQLLVKCVNNPKNEKKSGMIFYFQKNVEKYLRDFVFSTNENLIGFRCIYNLDPYYSYFQKKQTKQFSDNFIIKDTFENENYIKKSVISIGNEFWYASGSMSPGFSTALRYKSYSPCTGNNLTFTLACNPILGHISSTYIMKNSSLSRFCSKYDFNFFSYASDLSLGIELIVNSKTKLHSEPNINVEKKDESILKLDKKKIYKDQRQYKKKNNDKCENSKLSNPVIESEFKNEVINTNFKIFEKDFKDFEISSIKKHHETNNYNFDNDSKSILKIGTSLNDKNLKFLWQTNLKGFIVIMGFDILLFSQKVNLFNNFGITFSYAS